MIGKPGEENYRVETPSKVLGLEAHKITKVVCGMDFTFGLSEDGSVFSWGSGKCGLLGHGDKEDYEFPGRILSLSDKRIIGVSTGGSHCCAWTSDGRIYSWGKGRGYFYFLLSFSFSSFCSSSFSSYSFL